MIETLWKFQVNLKATNTWLRAKQLLADDRLSFFHYLGILVINEGTPKDGRGIHGYNGLRAINIVNVYCNAVHRMDIKRKSP